MTSLTVDSWAASLSFLHADVAEGLEPMARRLGLVMGRPAPEAPGAQEPNGYSGLARRGPYDRLLLSEWLLATEEPDEFMRRVVSSELSFLELERSEQRPPSQFYVVVDTGAEQVGAPRLAQLAALLVLCRRATELETSVSVGILGETPGQWRNGDTSAILMQWMEQRSTRRVDPSAISEWIATIDGDSSATWVLAGQSVEASDIPNNASLLQTHEEAWNEGGVTTLQVRVDDRTVDLPLPEPDLCVRILRGRGLFRENERASTAITGSVGHPRFHGAARRLLARGGRPNELHLIPVPGHQHGAGSTVNVKVKQFPGPVLAASFVGQRVVALVADGDSARIAVIGKSLSNVHLVDEPLSDLGLSEGRISEMVRTDLAPLHFLAGAVVALIDGQWWHFRPDQSAHVIPFTAMATSNIVDQPRWARVQGRGLWANDGRLSDDVLADATVHFGPLRSVAYQSTDGAWKLHRSGAYAERMEIQEGANVLGVSLVENELVLVLLSPGGHLLRLRGANLDRTLTKASRGGFRDTSLHPTLPLLAVQRDAGHIDVIDLKTSSRLVHLQVEDS